MILTTHALTGAVIGKNIENPWLVIGLSFFFHYLWDTFRHGEYLHKKSPWKDFWRVAADISTALSVLSIAVFFSDFSKPIIFNILLGTFFSMFPDLITFLYWKLNFKILEPLFNFHHWIHRAENPIEEAWNLRNARNDILISLAAMLLLFF